MGDENSLAGRTQAHKHEASSSTGGFLETGLTGVTNLSNGSMLYGNASEIVTELNAGSDGDQLKISAGVPSWVSGGGGSHAFVGADTVTTPRNSMSVSFPSISGDDLGQLTVCFSYQAVTSPATWRVRVNGISTASFYQTQRMTMNAGISGDFDVQDYLEGMASGARQSYGIMNFQCGTQLATTAGHDTTMVATGYGGSETPSFRGWQFTCVSDNGGVHGDDFNSFDEIELYLSGGNIQEGGRIGVWKTAVT